MIPNGRMDRSSTKQNGKQLLHFRSSCGKCSGFSGCCVNLYSFFVYNRVVWHVPQVQCWRLCIISKIFCNCVKVTVPSLPEENGVPVKINVIFY